jgi:hypothetical protein
LGRHEEALQWLARVVEMKAEWASYAQNDSDLAALYNHPAREK